MQKASSEAGISFARD